MTTPTTAAATFDREAAYREIVDFSKPAAGALLVVTTIDPVARMATSIWRLGDEIATVLTWTKADGTPVGCESYWGRVGREMGSKS